MADAVSLAVTQPGIRSSGGTKAEAQWRTRPAERLRKLRSADNPVADPKAVVMVGNARFTVLTPQLIRMEWSADGKFEDHASFVFINRRLPVPKFDSRSSS